MGMFSGAIIELINHMPASITAPPHPPNDPRGYLKNAADFALAAAAAALMECRMECVWAWQLLEAQCHYQPLEISDFLLKC